MIDDTSSDDSTSERTQDEGECMRIRDGFALAAAGLLLAACATSYQSSSFTGGFQDTQLAPDVFRVSFRGNSFTSRDRVQDFALLRAAELTLANGARYFGVMAETDQSRIDTHVSSGSARTTGTVSMYGNTGYYSGTTTYTAPKVTTYYKPGVGMMIRTFNTKPEGDFAFDAEFVSRSIRTKYGVQ
jgi:hypothetical protein